MTTQKAYEIREILSGIAKGYFTVIVNGWQMYGSFKTEAEAIAYVEARMKEAQS